MTIRDAIDQLLTGKTANSDETTDPSSVLAEHGYADVPTELFGTALVHFADTAPLEQADALAQVVTRVSPIPFEDSDLSESYGSLDPAAVEGGDAFALFAEADPSVAEPSEHLDEPDLSGTALGDPDLSESDLSDSDPEESGLDAIEVESDTSAQTDDIDDLDIKAVEDIPNETNTNAGNVSDALGAQDSEFGEGISKVQPPEDASLEEASPEQSFDSDFDLDALAPKFDPEAELPVDDGLSSIGDDLLENEGVDLFSVEFDESDQLDDGIDPSDLDFGIE